MDTIYRTVTTQLVANQIILSLPLSLSLSLSVSCTAASPFPPFLPSLTLIVLLFTFVCPSSKRPQAKQTYRVLTLNKLSDFVIGLQQAFSATRDENRKNRYPDVTDITTRQLRCSATIFFSTTFSNDEVRCVLLYIE